MPRSEDYGRIISIFAGYIPSGIAYGVLATAVHIPWYLTVALSFVVYSGAVQSAFVGFWSLGMEPFSMLLTAFLLNLRHTLYGPHLEEHYGGVSRKDAVAIGSLLTDEVYAIGVSEPRITIGNLKFLAVFSYLCWIAGTITGIAFTGILPLFILPVIYLALPALFLGLLVPRVSNAETVIGSAFSIISAVLFRLDRFPSYFILVSIFIGFAAGFACMKRRRRAK